jgi:predicted component of type VI protein secretion system
MMETKINWMICLLAGLLFGACSGNRPVQIQGVLEADPDIFPDYKGVTVPMNIAH